jgi:hypothetical protein
MESPPQTRWSPHYSDEPTSTTVCPEDADEEAQLIPREELEFEDGTHPMPDFSFERRGFWYRLRGPEPPQIQNIQPFFPSIQEYPTKLLDRLSPHHNQKLVLLVMVIALWLAMFSTFLTFQLPIKDNHGEHVLNLDCTDTLWWRKNSCGIDGINCRPFNNASFAFRCPAKCADVQVLNPRAVGPLDVNYRPLVIGADVYRGDSFICGSAIHAGVIDSAKGGCGHVNLIGKHGNFTQVTRNGIESIPFDSYFPLSFSLTTNIDFTCGSEARSPLLSVSLIFTAALSVSTVSPKIFFPIFTLIFAHVSFVSDPPSATYRNITVLPDHLSMFAKRLLPAFFVAIILWLWVVKRTLTGLEAQCEKTLFWLGGFWFGALSNYTFDWIPISRLTAHDLEQQPGAKVALAVLIILLAVIIAGQVYYFWLEGRLIRYLSLYALFLLGILLFLVIPGVNLRIHHYIIALLLLPGTSLQTRPSLFYQGILLGLFVNGIARWDFDSILQTTEALRGDGKLNLAVPRVLEPSITTLASNLTASFLYTLPQTIDGLSVIVNDVERMRLFYDDRAERDLAFAWTRPSDSHLTEYFRFAYVKGGRTFDYSKAGTLFGNGTWTT